MTQLLKTVSLFLILFLFSNCKGEKNTSNESEQTSPKEYTSKYENPEWMQKHNFYVSHYNDVGGAADYSLEGYFDDIPESGPKNATKKISLITIYDYPNLALENAQAIKIALPEFDSLSQAINDDFNMIMNTLNTAEGYYDREDYLDDDYKEGQRLHEIILKTSRSFEQKKDSIAKIIETLGKEINTFTLASFKANGYIIRYHVSSIMTKAQDVVKLSQVEDMDTYAKTDTQKVTALIDALTPHIKSVVAYTKEKENFNKEFNDVTADFYFDKFIKESNRMVKNLRRLKERIKNEDFERKNTFITNITADGLPDALIGNYNNLVEEHNNFMTE